MTNDELKNFIEGLAISQEQLRLSQKKKMVLS